MNNLIQYLTVLSILFLAGCGTSDSDAKKEKAQKRITVIEGNLYQENGQLVPLQDTILGAIDLYKGYAEQFPDDDSSASYLYKAATLNFQLGHTDQAVIIYTQVIEDYQGSKTAERSEFAIAEVYHRRVRNLNKAMDKYTAFAGHYPENSMAAEALYRVGAINEELARYDKAVEFYVKASKDKAFDKAAMSLFKAGYVADNIMNDTVNAAVYYAGYLADYPDQYFAPAATFYLEALKLQPEERFTTKIKYHQKELYGEGDQYQFDLVKAKNLTTAYEQYARVLHKKEKAGDYLFDAANLYRNMKDFKAAIATYVKIEQQYQEHPRVPQSIFLQAYVYENELNDMQKAKQRYEDFLRKYPDHDFARDAQFSLDNLGKSPEEIVEGFKDKNS